eukprot:6479950-Amphidinium_carterae.1
MQAASAVLPIMRLPLHTAPSRLLATRWNYDHNNDDTAAWTQLSSRVTRVTCPFYFHIPDAHSRYITAQVERSTEQLWQHTHMDTQILMGHKCPL